jgi:hypothetical protein
MFSAPPCPHSCTPGSTKGENWNHVPQITNVVQWNIGKLPTGKFAELKGNISFQVCFFV